MTRDVAHYFDSVFVIESLRPGNHKTGQRLNDELFLPATAEREDFSARCIPVLDRKGFFAAIELARTTFAEAGRSPILHFEMHGDKDGLELASGEQVLWHELYDVLTPINLATRCNLLVVCAACFGRSLIRTMKGIDRTPFWGVLGADAVVGDLTLLEGFRAFYKELLATNDGDAAFLALNGILTAAGMRCSLLDAEIYFCWVYEQYESSLAERDYEDRVSEIVVNWARHNEPNVLATAAIRLNASQAIRDHRRWYDFLRRRFLMLDLFPENKDRFVLDYDTCLARAQLPDAEG